MSDADEQDAFVRGFHDVPDDSKLRQLSFAELAEILSHCEQRTAKYIIVEHELFRRRSKDQFKSALAGAVVGGVFTIVGGFASTLVGGMGMPTLATKTTYEGCLLESLDGVESDLAARLIERSCREVGTEARAIVPMALDTLEAYGDIEKGTFQGSVYNGDSAATLSRITVEIDPKASGSPEADVFLGVKLRNYHVYVEVPPLATKSFSVALFGGDLGEYEWRIVDAVGFK